jgi:hypothetical protein
LYLSTASFSASLSAISFSSFTLSSVFIIPEVSAKGFFGTGMPIKKVPASMIMTEPAFERPLGSFIFPLTVDFDYISHDCCFAPPRINFPH